VDPRPIAAQLRRGDLRSAVASPAFFERLAECPDLGRLEALYTGGAPVFPDLLRRLQQTAPATRIVAVYGSTEAEPIAEIAASDLTTSDWEAMAGGRGLLAGAPVAGIDVAILPDAWGSPIADMDQDGFAARRQPAGQPGEIVVAGDHVLPGYLGGVGDAETKFRVAGRPWHRTGDAGWRDGLGRLWLLGRCSAIIRDDRGHLHPFAVETAARAIPGVVRAAMTAWGPQRLLVLEGRIPSAKAAEALAWARLDRIISAPVPMDRRHNAKVDYPALHRMLRRRLGDPHGQ
jgi:acyl-CoA synthetase (AMP-forming)/AMP-acid ligase II